MHNSKKDENCQSAAVFSVYVIYCNITNKHYVGVTRQKVTTRIRKHKRGKKQFIDKEIQKLSWEGNFDWWVVEENVPSNLISDCEQKWVAFFDCVTPKGYNKTCGGISKIIVTEETCAKMREIALARNLSGENNPNYGRKHTPEVKAAQSARMKGENNPNYGKPPANKGLPHTEEARAKISAANKGEKNHFYGKHHTPEAIEKNRQAHLGKHPSDEARAKMSESHKKENLTDETRAKLSESRKGEKNPFYGKHHTPESIEKNRQAHLGQPAWNKGKHPNAETRAKMSASAKARCARQKAAKLAALAAKENSENQETTS